MTFIAGLRLDQISAPWIIDGPINGELFTIYVEQVLAPTLAQGDIVVLDNLGRHTGKAARNTIRARGAHLIFLPPTVPISMRSNKSLPSSNTSCATPSPASSKQLGERLENSSNTNAQTISKTQAMFPAKNITL
jgi:DDE superfamily endonuclease